MAIMHSTSFRVLAGAAFSLILGLCLATQDARLCLACTPIEAELPCMSSTVAPGDEAIGLSSEMTAWATAGSKRGKTGTACGHGCASEQPALRATLTAQLWVDRGRFDPPTGAIRSPGDWSCVAAEKNTSKCPKPAPNWTRIPGDRCRTVTGSPVSSTRSDTCDALTLLCFLAFGVISPALAEEPKKDDGEWRPLFNGKNLDGWTPKIKGYELGDNHADTFRVEDGVLKVSYDKYTEFDSKFGHLFYKDKFSHYRLRVEYRFVGEQCKGGAGLGDRATAA